MKPESQEVDDTMKWDMTVVILLVFLIMFVLIAVISIGPLGHTT